MRLLTASLVLMGVAATGRADHQVFLTWQGDISGPVDLFVQDGRVEVESRRSRGFVANESFDFQRRVPINRNILVNVIQGSGNVRILDQPNSRRDELVVRIAPRRGGTQRFVLEFTSDHVRQTYNDRSNDRYNDDFDLSPTRRGERNRARDRNSGYQDYNGTDYRAGQFSGGNRIVWRGRVDGQVRLNIQGNRVWTETVSGQQAMVGSADFGSPLRNVNGVNVRRLEGRDEVRVLQQPSPNNGYRLVIDINDDDGGADDYAIEVTW